MKCPKCGYTSFDYHDACRKCGKSLQEERTRLGLPDFPPAPAVSLESSGEAEGYIPGLGAQAEQPGAPFRQHAGITFPAPPSGPPSPAEAPASGSAEPDVLSRPETDAFAQEHPPLPSTSDDEDPFSVDLEALGLEGEEPEGKSS